MADFSNPNRTTLLGVALSLAVHFGLLLSARELGSSIRVGRPADPDDSISLLLSPSDIDALRQPQPDPISPTTPPTTPEPAPAQPPPPPPPPVRERERDRIRLGAADAPDTKTETWLGISQKTEFQAPKGRVEQAGFTRAPGMPGESTPDSEPRDTTQNSTEPAPQAPTPTAPDAPESPTPPTAEPPPRPTLPLQPVAPSAQPPQPDQPPIPLSPRIADASQDAPIQPPAARLSLAPRELPDPLEALLISTQPNEPENLPPLPPADNARLREPRPSPPQPRAQLTTEARTEARTENRIIAPSDPRTLVFTPQGQLVPKPIRERRPQPARPNGGSAGDGVGVTSDRDSEAASLVEPTEVRLNGAPQAARGLEVRPTRANFSPLVKQTTNPRDPVVWVVFGRDGRVLRADFMPGRNTGYAEVDEPLRTSLFLWTAKGEALDKLPADEPQTGIEVEFKILMRR